MTQRGMFFDSSSGDRIYTSDAWAEIFAGVFLDGVIAGSGSPLGVVAQGPAALAVNVGLGAAFVQGRFFQIYSAVEALTITTANPTLPRIDRIIIRLDMTARTIALAVLTGTAASTPVETALTQNTTTWEHPLARVAVAAGATSIVTANITDERVFVQNTAAIAFGKVLVSGQTLQSTITGDTVEFIPGTNISLLTNTSPKQVTVAVSGKVASAVAADTLGGLSSSGFALAVHTHAQYLNRAGDTVAGQFIVDPPDTLTATVQYIRNVNGHLPFLIFRNDTPGAHDVNVSLTNANNLDISVAAGWLTLGGVNVPQLSGGGKRVTVASTAPAFPVAGDVWIDTSIVL